MDNIKNNKYIIETGMGLQDVDKLKNSAYFINETNKYINGEISLDELDAIISSYYKSRPNTEERTEEADKIAIRIAKIISEDSFTFTLGQLLTIHRILFLGEGQAVFPVGLLMELAFQRSHREGFFL